jgi:hypothetical protein
MDAEEDMIADKDRSFWIGASDTEKVMGNYNTKTWKKWWMQKLGINKDQISTKAMKVGTNLEHKILDTIPGIEKDRQITIEPLGLRVNYDGIKDGVIYEVKTYSGEQFKLTQAYRMQAQVEMLAYFIVNGFVPELYFLAYKVTEADYKNYFLPVDKARLQVIPIDYDQSFIDDYLPRLRHLHECIEKGVMP